MEIQITQQGETAVFAVSGRLDGVTATEYQTRMQELIEHGTTRVVVDFNELIYISSAGLGELVRSAKLLQEKDGKFCVANVHGNVGSVFEMCRMESLIHVHPSLADALAALA